MWAVVIELLHLEALGHEYVQIVIAPLLRGQILKEQHGVLELHALEVFREVEEQCSAHVAVELREAFILGEVSVPESDGLHDVELASEVATHPSVGEVHEVDIQLVKMLQRFTVLLFDQLLHFVEDFVHSRLQLDVVILNVIYKFAQTPECVCFNLNESLLLYLLNLLFIDLENVVLIWVLQVLCQKD